MAYTELSMFWDGKDIGHAAAIAPYYESAVDDFFELMNRSYGNVGVRIGNGNELEVTSPGANSIQVDTGWAAVNGKGYFLIGGVKPLVAASAPSTVRWDYVILRTTWSAKTVEATIRQGTAGGPPSLVQNDGVMWEIPLAYYEIDTSGNITNLTDAREFLGCNVDDTVNNGITWVQEFAHGAPSPAAGIGTGTRYKADTDANRPRTLGGWALLWDIVTDALRQSSAKLFLQREETMIEAVVINAPDNDTGYVDGNTRGAGAVDLQCDRSNAANVASGTQAVIGGGVDNEASGTQSTVSGGSSNNATATTATIGGGSLNEADNIGSTVAGGERNDAKGNYASVGGGYQNAVNNQYGTICGGIDNIVSQDHGAIGGGRDNVVSGGYGVIPGGQENEASGNLSFATGRGAVADVHGKSVQANGYFANPGDAQGTIQVIMRLEHEHTDANFYEMFLDGSGARLTIPADTVWTYRIDIVATTKGGGSGMDVASYSIVGNIENDNGVTTVNLATVTTLYEDIAGWDVQIDTVASTANDALVVDVKDGTAASEVIRWVARIELVEVTYPA